MKCESCGGDLYHHPGCGVGEHGDIIVPDAPAGDALAGGPIPDELVERCADEYEGALAEIYDAGFGITRGDRLKAFRVALAVAAPEIRAAARAEGAAERMAWTDEARAALGYYRDRMTPLAVLAVQNFLDAFTIVADRQRAPSSATEAQP